jgi:hypothetical protein
MLEDAFRVGVSRDARVAEKHLAAMLRSSGYSVL